MWSKILNVLLIVYAITNVILLNFFPYLLGSQIDKDYTKGIDTDAIVKFVDQAENVIGETGYCLVRAESPDCITVYLGSVFNETSERTDIELKFEVFDKNKFSSQGKIKQRWLYNRFRLDRFDTVTTISKDNVRITVTEETTGSRSEKAQQYLVAVMDYISTQ